MKNRFIAFMCVFLIVFAVAFSGCAEKVTYNGKPTTTDGKIVIGDGYDDLPDDVEIVIGEDGESYLVDGEGNSVIYEPPSSYVVQNNTPTQTTKTTTTTTKTTAKASTTTTTVKTTTTTTKAEKDVVYDTLRNQRKSGYATVAGLTNYNTDKLYIKFNTDKMWLVELHKGSYGSKTIGAEVGIYSRTTTDKGYANVSSDDELKVSMDVWQYVNAEAEPNKIISANNNSCWWLARFENGTLSGGEPSTLVVKCSITFPSSAMMDEFCDSLEEKGFSYGSIKGCEFTERYSVDGNTVTLVWKNYTD